MHILSVACFSLLIYAGSPAASEQSGCSKELAGLERSFEIALKRINTSAETDISDILGLLSKKSWKEDERLRLLVALANKYPQAVLKLWDNMNIKLERDQLQVASALAQKVPVEVANVFGRFQLESEKTRLELAILVAQRISEDYMLGHFYKFLPSLGPLTAEERYTIIKVVATHDFHFSEDLPNYGPLTKNQLLDLARFAARKSGLYTTKYLSNYGPLTQNERFEVAKLAAVQNGSAVNEFLAKYGELSEDQRFELAKIAAHTGGQYLEHYGLPQDRLFEVAKISAAENGYEIGRFVAKLGFAQNQRFELAKIAAVEGLNNVLTTLKNYLPLNAVQLFELAKIVADRDPHLIGPNLKKFGMLTNDQRFELAKRLAKKSAKSLIKYLARLGPFTSDQRFELVMTIVQYQSTPILLRNIAAFGDLSPDRLFSLLKVIAARDGKAVSECTLVSGLAQEQRFEVAKLAATSSGAAVARNFENFGELTSTQRLELARLAMISSGPTLFRKMLIRKFGVRLDSSLLAYGMRGDLLGMAKALVGGKWDEIEVIDDPELPIDLKRSLVRFSKNREDLLPPDWIPLLWDTIADFRTSVRLLKMCYAVASQPIDDYLPNHSGDILEKALGIPGLAAAAKTASSGRIRPFYTVGLEIQEALRNPAFESIVIDPAVLKKPSHLAAFGRLITSMRDYWLTQGGREDNWRSVLREFDFYQSGVRAENLSGLQSAVSQKLVETMKETFAGIEIAIRPDQLEKLQERWGSLEPINRLAARFSTEKGGWKNELPELARVFHAELQNNFEQFKFFGDPNDPHDQNQARRQLAILDTPEKKSAWKKRRYRLELFNPENISVQRLENDALEHAKTAVRSGLLIHLGAPEIGDGLGTLLSELTRTHGDPGQPINPIRMFEDARRKLGDDPVEGGQALIEKTARELLKTTDYATFQLLARRLKTWIHKAEGLQLDPDALSDIDSIDRLATLANISHARRAVLFTTVVNGARSLLTIGNSTPEHSCQSYDDGGRIETLLGYVKDANLQALLSFEITSSSFSGNGRQFEVLARALEEKRDIKASYDENRRVIQFQLDDQIIETAPITFAQVRRILKLGTNRDKVIPRPGLFLERSFAGSYETRQKLELQMASIVNELADDVGGVVKRSHDGSPLEIVGSRNPGGVYSDAAGGRQTGDYLIH